MTTRKEQARIRGRRRYKVSWRRLLERSEDVVDPKPTPYLSLVNVQGNNYVLVDSDTPMPGLACARVGNPAAVRQALIKKFKHYHKRNSLFVMPQEDAEDLAALLKQHASK